MRTLHSFFRPRCSLPCDLLSLLPPITSAWPAKSSISSLDPPIGVEDKGWTHDPTAWDFFCSLVTSLYAIFIVVFAFILELASMSQKLAVQDEWIVEMIFYSYMYGLGSLFLVYFYVVHIYPSAFRSLVAFARNRRWIRGQHGDRMEKRREDPPSASGSSHNLYLRLGMLTFGSAGIVLFLIEMFVCLTQNTCCTYRLVNWVLASFFTFFQAHFLFCHGKIVINESKNVVKLGYMHLVSTNLWTWLRFVVAKHEGKATYNEHYDRPGASLLDQNATEAWLFFRQNSSSPIFTLSTLSAYRYFGDFASLLTSCIIEYSVIGAAFMYCLHRSMDEHPVLQRACSKRKHKVSIDCSASSAGLFAGLSFLICSLVALGIYAIYSQHADDRAINVFRATDFVLFSLALLGSTFGIIRMRRLSYRKPHKSSNAAEFLDEILLIIGFVGELVHSSTGLLCWISTQSEFGKHKLETYMLIVFVVREIQVIVQTVFILVSSRLRAQSPAAKDGKQFVTFLLLANVSLFFFHTLEGMTSVFGSALESQRTKPYAILICTFGPLVVFYRFHSSVCLAEIWKNAYSTKGVRPLCSQQTSIDSTELPSEFSASSRSSLRMPDIRERFY